MAGYNAASDLIDGNLRAGRGGRVAVREPGRDTTYAQLAQRMDRAGNALRALGLDLEQRALLCLLDTVDFPAVFWGALKAGCVPVPVNTLLTPQDYDFMLRDSRARVLVASGALLEKLVPILAGQPFLRALVVSDPGPAGLPAVAGMAVHALDALLAAAAPALEPAETTPDDVAFWLYSSGSTGRPKGAIHLHGNLAATARLYGQGVLGLSADDVCFSAAKLFFAYGLGNGMTFPFSVGATAVLLPERPTPAAVLRTLREARPTFFFGVPTLFAALLADPACAQEGPGRLRFCVSAGEPLPKDLAERWKARFGVDVLDGLGSTEMLHIFLSLHPGDIRYGTSGKAVAGYELAIVDDADRPVARGELGELKVSGPSSAAAYWNNREKSAAAFRGRWTFTGDKYRQDEDGYYVYCGRSDDMIKAGGIWVSPAEVESALMGHDRVLEAAVVGAADAEGLIKPKAFVVLKPGGAVPSPALAAELQAFVKTRLAAYKYPRWIEFVDALPKTATGKIQRFKLRAPTAC
ncbi:MAG: benzoate-CoA ligase family protein [Myxococcales bacterium]